MQQEIVIVLTKDEEDISKHTEIQNGRENVTVTKEDNEALQ